MQEAAKKGGEDPAVKAAMAQQEMQQKEQLHQQKMRHTEQQAQIRARQALMKAAKKPENKGD
jgi:hypothetical protein